VTKRTKDQRAPLFAQGETIKVGEKVGREDREKGLCKTIGWERKR
jgi:hypothetical protein